MTLKENIRHFFHNTWKHRVHVIMALPTFLIMLLFLYVPMAGLVMAFKDFNYNDGIWRSPWKAPILGNFDFLTASKDLFVNMTTNTLMYYVIFTVLGTFLNVVLAICIDQMVFKKLGSALQSILIIPIFISYAAVQFIVYAYLDRDTGMINHLFGTSIRWYSEAKYWPVILTIVKMWNSVGYGSVLYMSVLAGVDQQLYEAAEIDGCGPLQSYLTITLPLSKPIIATVSILSGLTIWKDFYINIIVISDVHKKLVSTAMLSFVNEYTTEWSGVCAAMVIQSIPVIIIYLLLQKQFIKGITAGAVKG